MSPLPPILVRLSYAGLIPFIGLAILVQVAPNPVDYLSAESLASYGAVIISFLGALHWGACLKQLGKPPVGDRWIDQNSWLWGVIPAIIAWVALHIYIPVGLLILASILIIQRNIDQNTYNYYFSNDEARLEFMKLRNRITYVSSACLAWAAIVIIASQT